MLEQIGCEFMRALFWYDILYRAQAYFVSAMVNLNANFVLNRVEFETIIYSLPSTVLKNKLLNEHLSKKCNMMVLTKLCAVLYFITICYSALPYLS